MLDSQQSKDKVTICLFSTEKGPEKFDERIFLEKDNIRRVVEKLSQAAASAGKPPPEIVVSVLLVPDWSKSDNGYDNLTYRQTNKLFLKKLKQEFSDLNVRVQDFYLEGELSEAQKVYMHQLKALGSNLDIMKLHAVIHNKDSRHLQLDSNTIIKDYQTFYNKTFGASKQNDAINASFYDTSYVSAHTKVIYTIPNGKLVNTLEKNFQPYFIAYQNDAQDKAPGKNSVYAKVFSPTTQQLGLTRENFDVADDWHFYPADMTSSKFRITPDIVTAVKMSWAAPTRQDKAETLKTEALNSLPPLAYSDALYDFSSITYIIKKYTGYLPRNAVDNESAEPFYENLLNISDNQADLKVLAEFYRKVIVENPELTDSLARVFPNTPKGNLLTQAMFGCSVQELYLQSKPHINDLQEADISQLVKKLIELDKETINDRASRAPGYITATIFNKIVGKKLEVENLIADTPEATIYNFFTALEEGDLSGLSANHKDIAKLPLGIREKVLHESLRIVNQGNDSKAHFNYIPNRQQSLEIVNRLSQSIGTSTDLKRPQPVVHKLTQKEETMPSKAQEKSKPHFKKRLF